MRATVTKRAKEAAVTLTGAHSEDKKENDSSSSVVRSAFIASFVWWAIVIFMYFRSQKEATVAACLKSTNIITVLEMVPYKLHSPDLQSAIHTINTKYNVQAKFFDIEDSSDGPKATGAYAAGGAMAKGGAGYASGGLDTTKFREYNKFTMSFPSPNTIAGATNWMEYQLTFNDPTDISPDCLLAFSEFKFVNDDGSCQGCWS